jgi:hypothetical protein
MMNRNYSCMKCCRVYYVHGHHCRKHPDNIIPCKATVYVIRKLCRTGLVKVKLSLCLIKHHTIKTWENGSVVPLPLTLALDRGEQSASCPGHFRQTSPVPIRLQAGGPKSQSRCCREEKNLMLLPGIKSWLSSP